MGCLIHRPILLLLGEELGVGSSLSIVWYCHGCVSAFPSCFNVGDVAVGLAQLFSGFLLEGVALCLAEDLLCPWKQVNSGGSCLSILDLILPKASF